MSTTELILPKELNIDNDVKEIEAKTIGIVSRINEIAVVDNAACVELVELAKAAKQVQEINEQIHRPVINYFHRLHKDACAKFNEMDKPLAEGIRTAKTKMDAWIAEQERIRIEEERRLQELARKAEEERKLVEAIEAEQDGDSARADAILETPVVAPAIILPHSTPKIAGHIQVERWEAVIEDENALIHAVLDGKAPRHLISINVSELNSMARRLKDSMRIPGVKARSIKTSSISTRRP